MWNRNIAILHRRTRVPEKWTEIVASRREVQGQALGFKIFLSAFLPVPQKEGWIDERRITRQRHHMAVNETNAASAAEERSTSHM